MEFTSTTRNIQIHIGCQPSKVRDVRGSFWLHAVSAWSADFPPNPHRTPGSTVLSGRHLQVCRTVLSCRVREFSPYLIGSNRADHTAQLLVVLWLQIDGLALVVPATHKTNSFTFLTTILRHDWHVKKLYVFTVYNSRSLGVKYTPVKSPPPQTYPSFPPTLFFIIICCVFLL